MKYDHGYEVADQPCQANTRYGNGRPCRNNSIIVEGQVVNRCFTHWTQPSPEMEILRVIEGNGEAGATHQQLREKTRAIGQDAFDSALGDLLHRGALAKSYELRPNKAGRNQKQAVYRWAENA